jgi:hypothetical protein
MGQYPSHTKQPVALPFATVLALSATALGQQIDQLKKRCSDIRQDKKGELKC